MAEQIEVSEVVENWLDELNKNMVSTLKKSTQQIKSQKIENTFKDYCSQVICLLNELTFNSKAGSAISRKGQLDSLKAEMQQLLSSLTKQCHQTKEELVLAKIKSLILDVIHQISIIDHLLQSNIQTTADWPWHKQLKIIEEKGAVKLNMANSSFDYTF